VIGIEVVGKSIKFLSFSGVKVIWVELEKCIGNGGQSIFIFQAVVNVKVVTVRIG
jgi:hypothetical protein